MRGLASLASVWRTPSPNTVGSAAIRDRVARLMALLTAGGLTLLFLASSGLHSLMPGPLSSAHSTIDACKSCHARTGDGKLNWLSGLRRGEPHGDSKTCLTCHNMPETAFNAHGATEDMLQKSSERLAKMAAETSKPASAKAQNAAFPTHAMVAEGLECATCHQEHQGKDFNLKAMSNEQCRSCHTLKFDRFDGAHPNFEGYPFTRRTRIAFDHAGHFGKHYPELAKKEPGKSLPATCATCHESTASRRIMSILPFEKTCGTCHLDQITGKERASGPKGIAFLSLPGLDLTTLRNKGEQIGEWPEESEASLTPFMKVIIARTERGAKLIQSLAGVPLQDLSSATSDQIKAVTALVWEIKKLFHAMLSGKASDSLAGLKFGNGPALTTAALTDLTANLPRDVIASAQQQWLPNLAKEMAARPDPGERQRNGWRQDVITHKSAVLADMRSQDDIVEVRPLQLAQAESADDAPSPRRPLPSGTPRSIELRDQETEPSPPLAARAKPQLSTPYEPAAPVAADPAGAPPASSGPSDQTDELLAPTDAELSEIKAREKGAPPQTPTAQKTPAAAGNPNSASAKATAEADVSPPATATNEHDNSITAGIDPEAWADTGGWYRQDHAIYYRPAGHKDKFIASWLLLTGAAAPKGAALPEAAVFDALTAKDAQGACTKCHSIDEAPNQGRKVNFTPLTARDKAGHFTRFAHEPHFGLMKERGCITCHELQKGAPALKTYEQGDPKVFASNFGPVKKDICTSCHTASAARQDCTLCHAYHINGVSTPIMKTKIPSP